MRTAVSPVSKPESQTQRNDVRPSSSLEKGRIASATSTPPALVLYASALIGVIRG
jgi:hypothetical protein